MPDDVFMTRLIGGLLASILVVGLVVGLLPGRMLPVVSARIATTSDPAALATCAEEALARAHVHCRAVERTTPTDPLFCADTEATADDLVLRVYSQGTWSAPSARSYTTEIVRRIESACRVPGSPWTVTCGSTGEGGELCP